MQRVCFPNVPHQHQRKRKKNNDGRHLNPREEENDVRGFCEEEAAYPCVRVWNGMEWSWGPHRCAQDEATRNQPIKKSSRRHIKPPAAGPDAVSVSFNGQTKKCRAQTPCHSDERDDLGIFLLEVPPVVCPVVSNQSVVGMRMAAWSVSVCVCVLVQPASANATLLMEVGSEGGVRV